MTPPVWVVLKLGPKLYELFAPLSLMEGYVEGTPAPAGLTIMQGPLKGVNVTQVKTTPRMALYAPPTQ